MANAAAPSANLSFSQLRCPSWQLATTEAERVAIDELVWGGGSGRGPRCTAQSSWKCSDNAWRTEPRGQLARVGIARALSEV